MLAKSSNLTTLLINSPSKDPFDQRYHQPLGIAYLAAYLRWKKFKVKLLDANCRHRMSISEVVDQALEEPLNIVGISTTTEGFLDSIEISQRIKANYPNVYIIYGGHHATANHRELLKNYPVIDVVVRNEGEYTIYEVVDKISKEGNFSNILGISYRDGEKIRVNPPRPFLEDLDSLPFPARDLLPPLNQYAHYNDLVDMKVKADGTILSSRGCPYSCSFCSIQSFYTGRGKKWRARSPRNIAEEIEELIDNYKAEHITFVDDNFFIQPERTMEIFEELHERKRAITFSFATRPDQIIRNQKYISALRTAGCRTIELGIESGSQQVLQRLNKGTDVSKNSKAIKIIRENGIAVGIDMIMFDPETTIEELDETIRFIKNNNLYGYYFPFIYYHLKLYPGTDCLKRMVNSGKSLEAISMLPNWEFEDKRTSVVFSTISKFLHKYQNKLDLVIKEAQDMYLSIKVLIHSLSNQTRAKKELENLVTQCFLDSIYLKRIPYSFFEELLNAARDGRTLKLPYEDLTKKIPIQIERTRESLKLVKQALANYQSG